MRATARALFTIGPSARLPQQSRKAAKEGPLTPSLSATASVRSENRDAVPALLEGLGLKLVPLPISVAIPAAKAFAIYLDRLKKDGRKTENRVPLPDFLIGAHAKADGMKLVTRDPDRVKTYFPEVQLVTP